MADIAPMRPLHYDPALLSRVVAPPYDVIDAPMRKKLAIKHNHNVVHIDLPEGEGEQKYERARELFEAWQRESVLVRDDTPAFWRYAQTFVPPGGGEAITRKGFLSLVRAVPFSDRVVLPHERTLKGPNLIVCSCLARLVQHFRPVYVVFLIPSDCLIQRLLWKAIRRVYN